MHKIKTPKYTIILAAVFAAYFIYLLTQLPAMDRGRNKFGGNNNIVPFTAWTDAQGQAVNLSDFAKIGGDEFFIFLTDDEADHYAEYESEMRRLNAEVSAKTEHGVPLTIATGNYLFDGQTGQTIERAERLADRSMYEHKAEMKGKSQT